MIGPSRTSLDLLKIDHCTFFEYFQGKEPLVEILKPQTVEVESEGQ